MVAEAHIYVETTFVQSHWNPERFFELHSEEIISEVILKYMDTQAAVLGQYHGSSFGEIGIRMLRRFVLVRAWFLWAESHIIVRLQTGHTYFVMLTGSHQTARSLPLIEVEFFNSDHLTWGGAHIEAAQVPILREDE